ncbi:uncharacterized protein LOC123314085 [Coccinella septempunctata]|uniref:uncharacterized protein LOC123314085 n=1 Tax=Coccinella septempunctata TaxID=41139 RepID=UPI001D098F2B|nr:uncharacterized protein LOC123314085 [Coccinella septempunctata]
MIHNGVIFLKHLQQNTTVRVDGNVCMDVLYMNCKRHSPPKIIEVSLDLVMLGAPDYGLSQRRSLKVLEFCIRIHGLLPKKTRRNILFLLSKSKGIINVKRPHMVQKFLTKFFQDLPRTNQKEDVEFRDNIISYVRNIYGAVMNDPDLVNGFTSPSFVGEIYQMLREDVFGLPDTHKIIEILSIIAVHSDSASQALMEMGIAKTLLDLDEKWHTSAETHKMDLVTLVWALLPNLPEEYNNNKLLRRNAIRNIETLQWQREFDTIWIPFTPIVNYEIERNRTTDRNKQVLIIESDSIGEVSVNDMTYLDHSTYIFRRIRYVDHKVYEVLKLEKTKKSRGYRLKTNFAHFAYLLVYERIYDSFYDIERYQCLEALLSLVMNITRTQHDRIMPITANSTPVGTVQHLTEIIYKYEDSENGIVAMQTLAEFLRIFPDIYEEPCRKEGVIPTVEYAFREKNEEEYLAFDKSSVHQEFPGEERKIRVETTTQTNSTTIYVDEYMQVCLPHLPHFPQINPLPENLPQPKPPKDAAKVNTRLIKPPQRRDTKTTLDDKSKIPFRNQAKDLVRRIRSTEAAVTAVLPSQPKRPTPYCDPLNNIKRIFEDTELSLYEIRASGAIAKLIKILTGMKQREDLNNELRNFLNVFANLPKDENAKKFEIVSAPFDRTVCILNDILKYGYRTDSIWSELHSVESINIAGVQTLRKLTDRRFRISVLTPDHRVLVCMNSVFPFTRIQYLESYVIHIMNSNDRYKEWNESIEGKIELYLNDYLLPSHFTLVEAIRLNQRIPLFNIFEYNYVFTYKVKDMDIPKVVKRLIIVEDQSLSYASEN